MPHSPTLLPLTLTLTIFSILCPLITCGPNLTYCQQIPYNPITSCNVTCATCRTRNQCSTCPSYLTLSDGKCIVPTEERMYFVEYFAGQGLKNDKALLLFYTALGVLNGDNIFRFCIANTYRFDMIGLFSNDDQLTFSQTYIVEASQIAFNFRLFFATRIAIVKIEINSKMVYNITIDSGYSVNYTTRVQRDQNNVQWTIGIIDNDPSVYADQLFAPIRTGMIPLASMQANVKITVQNGLLDTGSQNTKFWAISELAVVTRKCRTCVSETIKKLSQGLGIVIGISFGVILLLLLVLHIYSKIKSVNYRKILKRRFHQSQRNSLGNDHSLSSSQRIIK